MIAVAIPSVAATMIGDSTLGRMWRVIIRRFGVPMDRAARMNSRSFRPRTSPRTIRAACIQLVAPIADTIRTKVPKPGPIAWPSGSRNSVTISSRSGSRGRARNSSVIRISGASSRRKKPDRIPIRVPSVTAISIAVSPTASDTCPPFISRASMSRPSWSVPSGCAALKPLLRARMSTNVASMVQM